MGLIRKAVTVTALVTALGGGGYGVAASTLFDTAAPVLGAVGGAASEAASDRLAVAALRELPVKGRAPKTGYDREQFGSAWSDVDRNGCDTRNDILRRDLVDETFKKGTRDCVVLTGTLRDPYTGRTIKFRRGQRTSSEVQVDHVVALSASWQTGAQRLTPGRRKELANDPLNLLAVDGGANQSKGDGDAATWLPPVKSYRCAYAARQIAVKRKYDLWVTTAEKAALGRLLVRCPAQVLP